MDESMMYLKNNCLIVKLVNVHGARNKNAAYLEAVLRAIGNIDLKEINEWIEKHEPIAFQHEGGIGALTAYPVDDKIQL